MIPELHKMARRFAVKAENISVIDTPNDFFEKMQELTGSAERRISWSSLYLGTNQPEQKLLNLLITRISQRPVLSVQLLLDASRSTRSIINTDVNVSTTAPLQRLRNEAPSASIGLFEAPGLRGGLFGWRSFLTSRLIHWNRPGWSRFREAPGVWHSKIYVFDDAVIISGANLSDSYFTNRQDRYILLERCPELATFYHDFITEMRGSSFCFDSLLRDRYPEIPSKPTVEKLRFFTDSLTPITSDSTRSIPSDTFVYPTFQLAAFGVRQDQHVMQQLFDRETASAFLQNSSTDALANDASAFTPNIDLCLASGYLNLPTIFSRALLPVYESHNAIGETRTVRILASSPQTNGWFGAKGLGQYIPSLYAAVAYNMVAKLESLSRKMQTQCQIIEYMRHDGWSFHCKGVWRDPGQVMEKRPFVTVVGSSNYSLRSLNGDLESQLLISTHNPTLVNKLRQERDTLLNHGTVLRCSSYDDPVLADVHHKVARHPIIRIATGMLRRFL